MLKRSLATQNCTLIDSRELLHRYSRIVAHIVALGMLTSHHNWLKNKRCNTHATKYWNVWCCSMFFGAVMNRHWKQSERNQEKKNKNQRINKVNTWTRTSNVAVSLAVSEKSSPSEPTFFASGDWCWGCAACCTVDISSCDNGTRFLASQLSILRMKQKSQNNYCHKFNG